MEKHPLNNNNNNYNMNEIIYTIPGQNGLGGSPNYLTNNIFSKNQTKIIQLQTPKKHIDLGQHTCMSFLDDYKSFNSTAKIVHVTSQSTSTLLNYLCTETKHKLNNIQCIIFESVMASGNSAIYHTVISFAPFIKIVDSKLNNVLYYILPYIVKLFHFPYYKPTGLQPIKIKSMDNIHKDTVFIISHSAKDSQLNISDAKALYYKLKYVHHFEHVYFNIKLGFQHINLIQTVFETATIQSILSSHNILQFNSDNFDISKEHEWKTYPINNKENFKQCYDELLKREHKLEQFEKICVVIFCIVLVYFLIFIVFKLSSMMYI
ncbi:MAG: hypothetical protein MUO21_01135 [Nitrososphaeraceae archaeon]|nr:hypothetical protein [Nitrososphaeraceae archaeon]